MIVNANTKIGALIRHNPEALEAIVGLSPKFIKLRHPLLRKVIAGRTSIAMASRIGACRITDFFNKLRPLGFEIDESVTAVKEEQPAGLPDFLYSKAQQEIIAFDVRPVFDTGQDPLSIILQQVKALKTGQVLKLINSFEPTPLMHLLGKQGFESYAEHVNDELVFTYFYKKTGAVPDYSPMPVTQAGAWEEAMKRFADSLETVDVRALEMPLPMHAIMEALETLPTGKALFVYHKRIPVFLLPELAEQHFSYLVKEIGDGEVHLLIYKD